MLLAVSSDVCDTLYNVLSDLRNNLRARKKRIINYVLTESSTHHEIIFTEKLMFDLTYGNSAAPNKFCIFRSLPDLKGSNKNT
jgi:hypothetical protein